MQHTPPSILRLASRDGVRRGNDLVLTLPLTQQEIAGMIDARRPAVRTSLGNLQQRGVLFIDSHRLVTEREELLAGLTG